MSATNENLQNLLNLLESTDRVCPLPKRWNSIWNIISRLDENKTLSAPLILNGWYMSNNLEKMLRFRSHLEFASKNNCLDKVVKILDTMTESVWHHFKDPQP